MSMAPTIGTVKSGSGKWVEVAWNVDNHCVYVAWSAPIDWLRTSGWSRVGDVIEASRVDGRGPSVQQRKVRMCVAHRFS